MLQKLTSSDALLVGQIHCFGGVYTGQKKMKVKDPDIYDDDDGAGVLLTQRTGREKQEQQMQGEKNPDTFLSCCNISV